jgi:thymidylate synthase ThyX
MILEKTNDGIWLFNRKLFIKARKTVRNFLIPRTKKTWTLIYESGRVPMLANIYGVWNGYDIWFLNRYFFIGVKSKNKHIMEIKAKIIADSKNEFGQRLTTFVLTFPRIVLAEFNTHRMLSRNSASSRAIPFAKMLKMVQENPFIPIKWMKDHKGMQGYEYFTESEEQPLAMWLQAKEDAINCAKYLSNLGLTKQVVNRLLEPFMWHTVIVTASEWENFFALRAHPDAEIHIQELAHKMLEQYNIHSPKQLKAGEWHIPFGDTFNSDVLEGKVRYDSGFVFNPEELEMNKVKIATARCARVSYLNFEGKDDYEADIKLHDQLLASGHMSPFEHCAQAMSIDEMDSYTITYPPKIEGNTIIPQRKYGVSGNFKVFYSTEK